MKTKTLVVICIATLSIALISCDWLFGKRASPEKTGSIVGKWTISNITDSSKEGKISIVFPALAMIAKDSTPLTIEFRSDSTYGFFQHDEPLEDTGRYSLDSALQTLLLKEDSSLLNIQYQTDSSLQLVSGKDSICFTLIKQ